MRHRTQATHSRMDQLIHGLAGSPMVVEALDEDGLLVTDVGQVVTEAVTLALLQRYGDATQEELAMASLIILTHVHQAFQDALVDLSRQHPPC